MLSQLGCQPDGHCEKTKAHRRKPSSPGNRAARVETAAQRRRGPWSCLTALRISGLQMCPNHGLLRGTRLGACCARRTVRKKNARALRPATGPFHLQDTTDGRVGRNSPLGLLAEESRFCLSLPLDSCPFASQLWRHTCATHLVQNHANLRHVQDLLGHRSLTTTERYLRLTIADLKEAHARFHPREREEPPAKPAREQRPD